jgi:hypothetical protein
LYLDLNVSGKTPVVYDGNKKLAFEEAAQEIADFLRQHYPNNKPLKAKFPWKYIRPLSAHNDRWPYLSKARRRTVACAIQLCDINRFHLNVWDVSLTAGTMWQWHCSLPVVAVIEALLYEVGVQEGWLAEDARFKKAIDVANSRGIFKQNVRDGLHQLREFRNEIHLFLKDTPVEMCDGKPTRYNTAVKLLRQVEKGLSEHFRKKI